MKRLLLGLLILLILTGCKLNNNTNIKKTPIKEITTYKEVIKDGKVIIDGISYDIKSVTKIRNTYDDNENIIEKITTNDDSETRIEYLYENNQLIEERRYSNDKLSTTTYHYYENNLLIKRKTVYKSGKDVATEYSYGDKTKTLTHYNSDGSIAFISSANLDDDDKILKITNTTSEGEVISTSTFHYDNDLLTKVISEDGGIYKTHNYQYNNIGDKIMEYNITFMGKDNLLVAVFYDIEYDENLLPKTVTIHRVQSRISDEDIRNYQQ